MNEETKKPKRRERGIDLSELKSDDFEPILPQTTGPRITEGTSLARPENDGERTLAPGAQATND